MSEAKNIFAILDELKGNAKQIDNEGLESVEKLITEAKRKCFKTDSTRQKDIFNWKRKIRVGGEGFCKQIDASWIYSIFCW